MRHRDPSCTAKIPIKPRNFPIQRRGLFGVQTHNMASELFRIRHACRLSFNASMMHLLCCATKSYLFTLFLVQFFITRLSRWEREKSELCNFDETLVKTICDSGCRSFWGNAFRGSGNRIFHYTNTIGAFFVCLRPFLAALSMLAFNQTTNDCSDTH